MVQTRGQRRQAASSACFPEDEDIRGLIWSSGGLSLADLAHCELVCKDWCTSVRGCARRWQALVFGLNQGEMLRPKMRSEHMARMFAWLRPRAASLHSLVMSTPTDGGELVAAPAGGSSDEDGEQEEGPGAEARARTLRGQHAFWANLAALSPRLRELTLCAQPGEMVGTAAFLPFATQLTALQVLSAGPFDVAVGPELAAATTLRQLGVFCEDEPISDGAVHLVDGAPPSAWLPTSLRALQLPDSDEEAAAAWGRALARLSLLEALHVGDMRPAGAALRALPLLQKLQTFAWSPHPLATEPAAAAQIASQLAVAAQRLPCLMAMALRHVECWPRQLAGLPPLRGLHITAQVGVSLGEPPAGVTDSLTFLVLDSNLLHDNPGLLAHTPNLQALLFIVDEDCTPEMVTQLSALHTLRHLCISSCSGGRRAEEEDMRAAVGQLCAAVPQLRVVGREEDLEPDVENPIWDPFSPV